MKNFKVTTTTVLSAFGLCLLLIACGRSKLDSGLQATEIITIEEESSDATEKKITEQQDDSTTQTEVVLEATEAPPAEDQQIAEATPTPAATREPTPEPTAVNVTHVVQDSNPFRLKSSSQVSRTVAQCLGEGRTTVSDDMLLIAINTSGTGTPTPAPTASTDTKFLDPSFKAGSDIVTAQKDLMDGNEIDLRSGVRPEKMSMVYLTALRNIANVAAFNCDAKRAGDAELCKCESVDAAKEMINRCIPDLIPSTFEFELIATGFSEKCKIDRKAAISSMIASYAFAKSP